MRFRNYLNTLLSFAVGLASLPAVANAGPFKLVNLRGPGGLVVSAGACSGLTCTASNGHCQCDTVSGTATGAGFGKVSYVAALTINNDQVTPTGVQGGRCSPADGIITTTQGRNVAVLAATGTMCKSFVGGSATAVFNLAYAQEPQFSQSGKFVEAFGAGSVFISDDESASGTLPAAFSLAGTVQLKP